ncbi:hypothetical protein SNEBB_010253 [Seison nebaliae]|nr:hypothetical protein SNEBB_010253 [Seison nebaliae]
MSSNSKTRLAEIEEKRRRLDELRAANRKRQENGKLTTASSTTNFDDIIEELGLTTTLKKPEKVEDEEPIVVESLEDKLSKLKIDPQKKISIEGTTRELYSKEIQTMDMSNDQLNKSDKDLPELQQRPTSQSSFWVSEMYRMTYSDGEMSIDENTSMSRDHSLRKRRLSQQNYKRILRNFSEQSSKENINGHDHNYDNKYLTEEERTDVENSDAYSQFLTRNSKICERILCQNSERDIITNFDLDYMKKKTIDVDTDEMLEEKRRFHFEEGGERFPTSLAISPHYPELLMVSHYKTNDNANKLPKDEFDDEGLVLLWNTKFSSKLPESQLSCESWVSSACFSKFHSSYVIGGTQAGTIVIWDVRASRQPVMRTNFLVGHTKMVIYLDVVGRGNSNNIISVGKDGRLCTWNIKKLKSPTEILDLTDKKLTPIVNPNCFTFFAHNTKNFLLGTVESSIYSGSCTGLKAGLNKSFQSFNPIQCLAMQQAIDGNNYNMTSNENYFLSSATSNVIDLWNTKDSKPFHRFLMEHRSIVNDIQWSPVHPAVFATCNDEGVLKLWNLNENAYASLVTEQITDLPLTQVCFSGDGKQLTVGLHDGTIRIYGLNEIFYKKRSDDWIKFNNVMHEMSDGTSLML